MKTQRDMMRESYRRYGQDEERVVREYAAAEERGEVERKSNSQDHNSIQYARALWKDGVRKGWIFGS